jgi:hypothetical protein
MMVESELVAPGVADLILDQHQAELELRAADLRRVLGGLFRLGLGRGRDLDRIAIAVDLQADRRSAGIRERLLKDLLL